MWVSCGVSTACYFSPALAHSSSCLQTLALWRFTRYLILTALPFKLVNDLSQFVAPTFLNLLLGVVSSGQPSSVGYMYATLMLALLILGTASDNQHFQRVMRGGDLPLHFTLCLKSCPLPLPFVPLPFIFALHLCNLPLPSDFALCLCPVRMYARDSNVGCSPLLLILTLYLCPLAFPVSCFLLTALCLAAGLPT